MVDKPNILLVILDATRFDACSCYGQVFNTTPTIDKLAQEGVLYEQAVSAAPWTLPAMSSIFTGCYPGQTDIYLNRKLSPEYPTLANSLSQNGYSTFGITNNDWLSSDFGLQKGFQTLHKQWQYFQLDEEITYTSITESDGLDSIAKSTFDRIRRGNLIKNLSNAAFYRLRNMKDYGARRIQKPLIKWISQQSQPWFAFVHYLEPHLEYKPPNDFIDRFAKNPDLCKRLKKSNQWRLSWRHNGDVECLTQEELEAWRDLYIAEVAYTDFHLNQVVEWLRQQKLIDDTIIVITADHGENLGEHGLLSHSYSLQDTLIHVPLIIRYPKCFPAGEKVKHQVQTLDLFATLLDAANIPIPPDRPSKSLLINEDHRPYTLSEYGAPVPPDAIAISQYGIHPEDLQLYQRGLSAFRKDPFKLIIDSHGSVNLYNWRVDPYEINDLAIEKANKVSEMLEELKSVWKLYDIDGVIGPPTKWAMDERLRALGYLD